MDVYAALIYDAWGSVSTLIGVFSTEENAVQALNIVMEQKKRDDGDKYDCSRFDCDIVKTQIDAISSNQLWLIMD